MWFTKDKVPPVVKEKEPVKLVEKEITINVLNVLFICVDGSSSSMLFKDYIGYSHFNEKTFVDRAEDCFYSFMKRFKDRGYAIIGERLFLYKNFDSAAIVRQKETALVACTEDFTYD